MADFMKKRLLIKYPLNSFVSLFLAPEAESKAEPGMLLNALSLKKLFNQGVVQYYRNIISKQKLVEVGHTSLAGFSRISPVLSCHTLRYAVYCDEHEIQKVMNVKRKKERRLAYSIQAWKPKMDSLRLVCTTSVVVTVRYVE